MKELFLNNLRRLPRFFLAGILAVLPVVITVAIVTGAGSCAKSWGQAR